jgi:hypothetical protein
VQQKRNSRGVARPGLVWQGWPWSGLVRLGWVRYGKGAESHGNKLLMNLRGPVWHGPAGQGVVWFGLVWPGKARGQSSIFISRKDSGDAYRI